jgi:hypothetical protein
MVETSCSSYREAILLHFLHDTALGIEARDHYVGCVSCITVVTAALSKNVTETMPTRGPLGTDPVLSEAAQLALEHGRQVLRREFGISPE